MRLNSLYSPLFALTLLVLACPPAPAAEALPDGLTIEETTLFSDKWRHGTVERSFIINNPTTESRRVRLTIPDEPDSGEGLRSLSQTVLANAGSRSVISINQPAVAFNTYSEKVAVQVGNRAVREVRSRHVSVGRAYDSSPLNLLLSNSLSAEDLQTAFKGLTNLVSGYSSVNIEKLGVVSQVSALDQLLRNNVFVNVSPLRFDRGGAAWPQNWIAYSSFDSCLIAAADYEQMPAAARQALRDYVAVGGHVTFVGTLVPPENWGPIANLRRLDTWRNPPAATDEHSYGLGHFSLQPVTSFSSLSSNEMVSAIGSWVRAAHPWYLPTRTSRWHGDNVDFLPSLPVVPSARVPLRSFLMILLIYVILAGPVALHLTRRTNRRIWLLVAVPAFSLAFSFVIFGYALVSEGITPSIYRQSLTLLDQPRQHAATWGAFGVYTPLALRDGLHFDHHTEVSPFSDVFSGRIEIGRDQHYVAGWVQSRIPAFFRLRRSETRSERLVVRETAAGLEVVNALGAPIRLLLLCDSRGHVYDGSNLATGEKRLLQSTGLRRANAPLLGDFLGDAAAKATDIGWHIESVVRQMQPGVANQFSPEPASYIALLDGAPFIENPLAGQRNKDSARSIVAGWFTAEGREP